jgi:lambda repressor-like predicted transcriptional regulator/uncharacterized protein (DUF433 family)
MEGMPETYFLLKKRSDEPSERKGRKSHHVDEGKADVIIGGKTFTAEEYKKIVERRKRGEPITDIARDIGVDRKRLQDKFDQQKIRPEIEKEPDYRKIGNVLFTQDAVKEIVNRRKTGEPVNKIAKDIGISKDSLRQFFDRKGIMPELKAGHKYYGRKQFTDKEITTMFERRKNGEPIEAIAKDFGLDGTSLRRILDAKGVVPESDIKFRPRCEYKTYNFSRQDVLKGNFPPEIKNQINQMRKNGESARSIAEKFNIEPRTLATYFTRNDEAIFGKDLVQIGADRVSKENARKMIEARKNGQPVIKIARKYNVKDYSLGKFFQKQKIEPVHKDTSILLGKQKFSEEKMAEICERRKNGASTKKLAVELQISEKTLGVYFFKKDVHMNDINQREINRKYDIDHDFFKKIDSSNKAYLLGLILTDGNIHKQHNSLRFDFQKRDRELCEIARNFLSSTAPIHERDVKRGGPQVYIQFNSKPLCEDLKRLGVEPGAKEYNNLFPDESKVPREFQRDLIRGILDGDGSVIISNRNGKNSKYLAYSVSLSGTHELLWGVQKVLVDELKLNETKLNYDKRTVNNYSLIYGGIGNLAKIFEYIYPAGFKPEGNCLQRKYDRMKKAWSKHQSRMKNRIF